MKIFLECTRFSHLLCVSARRTLCSSRETRPRKCPPLREISPIVTLSTEEESG
jgi:hypothetical protein